MTNLIRLLLGILVIFVGIVLVVKRITPFQDTIKVGILHSLTGTMAISEKPVADATLLAIEEINRAGGLLGKKLEPIIIDGKSNPQTFAEGAKKLIADKVAVVFGGWTSDSRKTIKPLFEKYNSLLFYPIQYEGLEESPNIVYTGATPNQQIIPGVKWARDNLGKRFFLVGSDYVFPRTANAIIKELIQTIDAEVVGEEYLELGSTDVEEVIRKIQEAKPDAILNTINGSTNIPFFKALRAAGITSEKVPTMSFSIAEPELRFLSLKEMIGDYAARSYFQTVQRDENQQFIQKFKKKFGKDAIVSDPLEAAYFGVNLWARAVTKAQTTGTDKVRAALKNEAFNAPEGVVHIDPSNQHTWKMVRIGKIRSDGEFSIVWDSKKTIKPVPYQILYKSKQAWEQFLADLYKGWGNRWAK